MRIFHLQSKYFRAIQTGRKTVEGRPNKPDYKVLKIGDLIRFQKGKDLKRFVDVKIVSLRNYPSFREMLRHEGLQKCLPGIPSLDVGEKIYYGFPSYREKERMLGVLAIGIELNKTGGKV